VLGRREGIWFEDAYSGRRFINCHCNGGVFNLGHCRPAVSEAVRDVLGRLDIGNHHLLSGHRARLAERLSATTGDALSRVVFCVSGGEAVDVALKVARGAAGRSRIVSARGGYHGHTGLALAAGDAPYREPFGSNLPGFVQVPFDDLAALDEAVDDDTAAVILETIPATLGMPIPSAEYFPGVERLCRERGARLVIDEVQTGLGRTGRWWGHQHEGIAPDAIVTGKGLSGGIVPITATLMTPEMHAVLDGGADPFVHISTYGGSELGCVAANAVLDVVGAPGFLERISALSERFAEGFAGLPFDLRRRGLFMGLRFPSSEAATAALLRVFEAGVFAFPAGNDRSVLQFLPPLVVSDAEADDLIARVRRALGRSPADGASAAPSARGARGLHPAGPDERGRRGTRGNRLRRDHLRGTAALRRAGVRLQTARALSGAGRRPARRPLVAQARAAPTLPLSAAATHRAGALRRAAACQQRQYRQGGPAAGTPERPTAAGIVGLATPTAVDSLRTPPIGRPILSEVD
jgi:acetylornithine/succinyldiaminopimelate/putrescine aminotransferase